MTELLLETPEHVYRARLDAEEQQIQAERQESERLCGGTSQEEPMGLLDSVTKEKQIKPPRIVIHGKGGVGKTTFGAHSTDPVFLPAEEGLGTLEVAHLPKPSSYAEVIEVIAELQSAKHSYRTFVIDTIDHVEPLVWEEVCRKKSESSNKTYEHIEDFGYAKGYVFADPLWIHFFEGLDALRRDRNMTTIVLCHNESKVIEDPMLGPYDRITPKLHKRANALLYEWADIVGYLDIERSITEKEGARGRKVKTTAVTGRRILYLEDQGSFLAKNRYGLPSRIQVPHENPYQALRLEIAKALGLGQTKEAA